MFGQGVATGFFIAVISLLFLAPDSEEKIVEVLPEEYFMETNIQDTVCMGPYRTEVVGSNVQSRRITN